jgi:hypothetical protein
MTPAVWPVPYFWVASAMRSMRIEATHERVVEVDHRLTLRVGAGDGALAAGGQELGVEPHDRLVGGVGLDALDVVRGDDARVAVGARGGRRGARGEGREGREESDFEADPSERVAPARRGGH